MRVITCCANTGHTAGAAATFTNDFTPLDVKYLQNILKTDGVKIHINEL